MSEYEDEDFDFGRQTLEEDLLGEDWGESDAEDFDAGEDELGVSPSDEDL